MKNFITFIFALLVVGSSFAAVEGDSTVVSTRAQESITLDQQLDALSVPTNENLPGVSKERLYSVQSRFVTLKHRHEISLGMGRNFNPDSFTTSGNFDLGYRFYLSDRWYLNLDGSYVFNGWSSGAERLMETGQTKLSTLGDVAFAKFRSDLLVGYHLFYGKFRVSMDQVFYLDQYIALGPGFVSMRLSDQVAAVGELGIAFWFGRSFSTRIGLKDYFVKEVTNHSTGWAHNIIGSLQFGYVFGG